MKYCTKCGKQLYDEAVVCMACGHKVNSSYTPNPNIPPRTNIPPNNNAARNRQLLNTLSQRIYIDGIIWIVIGALQILTGVFFIIGVLNIISAINDLKYSKEVLKYPVGIVERYEPLTMPIIVFVYNLVFGGVIGVVGSIYYFIAIRGFVMENRQAFASMQ